MTRNFVLAILASVIFFFMGGISAAQDTCDPESQGNFISKQFTPGSTTAYSGITLVIPGVANHPRSDFGFAHDLTVEQVGPAALAAFHACTAVCGTACRIEVTGHADTLPFEKLHNAHNGGLAADRAGIVGSYVKANLDTRFSDVEAVAEDYEGRRFVEAKVYVATAIPVDLPNGTTARAQNVDQEALWKTGAAASRMFRDVSNMKCPWEIEMQWHPGNRTTKALITGHVNRIDPLCLCDVDGPFPTEDAYEDRLQDEVGNRPLAYPDDPVEAQNQYDATRSVVFDDMGAEWDEQLFYSHEILKIRRERNFCAEEAAIAAIERQQKLEKARLDGYKFDLYGRGNAMVGGVNVPGGSPFQVAEGTMLTGLLELGLHVGSPYVNWTIAGLAGPEHNPNCLDPATLTYGGVTGVTFLRPYKVGGEVHVGYLHSFGTFADGDGRWLDAERDSTFIRVGPRFHTGETVTLGFDGWMTTYWLSAKAGNQFSDTNAQGGGIAGFVEARF